MAGATHVPINHQRSKSIIKKIAPHHNTTTSMLDRWNKTTNRIFSFWAAPDFCVGVILKYVESRMVTSDNVFPSFSFLHTI
jgi:hypothetical protein